MLFQIDFTFTSFQYLVKCVVIHICCSAKCATTYLHFPCPSIFGFFRIYLIVCLFYHQTIVLCQINGPGYMSIAYSFRRNCSIKILNSKQMLQSTLFSFSLHFLRKRNIIFDGTIPLKTSFKKMITSGLMKNKHLKIDAETQGESK